MILESKRNWWQKNWLFIAGGIFSIGYLLWFYETGNPGAFSGLKLNEKGDFLAGLFSPLAFLWLVLGFVQQGQELRLQIEELNESVKAQRDQAKHTEQNSRHVAREVFLRIYELYLDELAAIAMRMADSRTLDAAWLVREYKESGNRQNLFRELSFICTYEAESKLANLIFQAFGPKPPTFGR
jgi:hypothetical protein